MILLRLLVSFCLVAAATVARAAAPLPRSTPEAQGIASSAILKFVEEADAKADALHSFMLLRHGQVVAEGWWAPYAANEPHMLFSLSKSFTSTAVGLAVAEGRLSIDDPVLKFFPEQAPAEPSQNLRAMRVRDLLTMSTGHHAEDIDTFPFGGTDDLVKTFLSRPVAHKPGTLFVYNTPATYMQSAIVQKLTDQTVLDYLRSRLFEPLGIDDPAWQASAQGISMGGFGLSIRTEDIAKFGQLYLQRGQWQGKQLIPASWVQLATAKQVSNGSDPAGDWDQGYGFQFWRCRHGAYRGDGAFGQFCIVLPEQDAVIAITSGTGDMGRVMALAWELLLPAMQAQPLAPDGEGENALKQRLAALALPAQGGSAQPGLSLEGRRFTFSDNPAFEAMAFGPRTDQGQTLTVKVHGMEQTVVVPAGRWAKLPPGMLTPPDSPVAVSGGWTAPDTFTMKMAHYRGPFVSTYQVRTVADELRIDGENNVGFGSTKFPQMVGKADAAAGAAPTSR